MRVRRKVITLKELISHFHSLMDTIQKESPILNSKHSFSKRTDYLPERYELANGQEVHLEIGQRAHISDILEIQRQGYEGKTPWGFVALENDIVKSQKSLYLLIYNGTEPVAFLGSRFEITDIHITNIAVAPAWQGKGVGSLLLELLTAVAKEEKVSSITLEVRISNSKAQALYNKLGFKAIRIKRNYYHGDGEDAVDMKLNLANV